MISIYKVISIDYDRCARIEQHQDFYGGVKIGMHNCFKDSGIKVHQNYWETYKLYVIGTAIPHSRLYTSREWQYQQFME